MFVWEVAHGNIVWESFYWGYCVGKLAFGMLSWEVDIVDIVLESCYWGYCVGNILGIMCWEAIGDILLLLGILS